MIRRLLLVGSLLLVSLISLFVGVTNITPRTLVEGIGDEAFVLMVSRVPRTVSLVLAGIGLSICGLIMQQLTRNKFVSPTTAGSLEAAQLGLLAGLLLFPMAGTFVQSLFAFGFSFIDSIIFFMLLGHYSFRNFIYLPLVGLMFGGVL